MALSKIDVANMVTGAVPVANGGTALTSGFVNGGGLTMTDQWRLTSTFTGDANPIASNLEQVDTSGQGTLGSAMTESSGIFTFPATGIYLVRFILTARNTETGGSSETQLESHIEVTTNNSSYTLVAETHGSDNSENSEAFTMCETLVDVTNTTNVKVRFTVETVRSGTLILASSTKNNTHMTFTRLGDT